MRLLWYNIQNPLDPQVNGFGLYRTAVDGVTPLLVARKHIGGRSTQFPDVEFSLTQPWEAADCSEEALVPVWSVPTQYTFNDTNAATVTIGPTTNGQIKTNVDATGPAGNDYRIVVAAATGANDAASASIATTTVTVLLGKTSGSLDAAKNTATILQALIDGLAGVNALLLGTGADSWTQTQIDQSPYAFTGGTDGVTPQPCTASQIWEIDPILHTNSEDTYRVTQFWELSFLKDYLSRDVLQNRITWAFASTKEDDDLGAEVEYDNDVPVGNHLVASFQEHLFAAGDPDNPHYLYYTKRFRPESQPPTNFIEIGTANDPITALVPIAGLMGMFTRDTKYRVSGNATTGFTHYEAISRRGTRATKSAVASDKGIIFVANDGVFTTNLIGPDTKISGKIESLFSGVTVGDEKPINQAAMDQVAAAYYKSKYYFVYPSGSKTTPDRMAVYSFDSEEWTLWSVGGGSMLYEPDTDALILGGDAAFVYILESGTTDEFNAVPAELWTKEFQGASYNTNNLFLYLKVDCEVANGSVLTAKFYVDEKLKHTLQLTNTGRRVNDLHPLPEGTFGKRWQTRITLSDSEGETKLYGVAAVFLPLASS